MSFVEPRVMLPKVLGQILDLGRFRADQNHQLWLTFGRPARRLAPKWPFLGTRAPRAYAPDADDFVRAFLFGYVVQCSPESSPILGALDVKYAKTVSFRTPHSSPIACNIGRNSGQLSDICRPPGVLISGSLAILPANPTLKVRDIYRLQSSSLFLLSR